MPLKTAAAIAAGMLLLAVAAVAAALAPVVVPAAYAAPPVVDAGSDQIVNENAMVTLNASIRTSVPIQDNTWRLVSPADLRVTGFPAYTTTVTFTAPYVAGNTTLIFEKYALTSGGSDTDRVSITVTDTVNRHPNAEAGNNQTVRENVLVTLDGSRSGDQDYGTDLAYSWRQTGGRTVALSNYMAVSPSFVSPYVNSNATLAFELTVSDGNLTNTDTAHVHIHDFNLPPIADAGRDRTVFEGDTVTIFGSATDPDPGDTLTYAWGSRPHNLIVLNDSDTLSPTFTAPSVSSGSDFVLTLEATDQDSAYGLDEMTLTVLPDNLPLVAVTPVGGISNGTAGAMLGGANDIATFTHNGTTYAAVAASGGGVQVLSLANPAFPAPVDRVADTDGTLLASPNSVVTFQSGGHTYAAVTVDGGGEEGVQILSLADPASPAAAGHIAANDTAGVMLHGALGIDTFGYGGHTYAVVAASGADAVQVLNLTDPADVTAAGHFLDNTQWPLVVATEVSVFHSGGLPYAAVTSGISAGVTVLNLTDPAAPAPVGSVVDADWVTFDPDIDTDGVHLQGAYGIDTFESGGDTYAAVTSVFDRVPLQILNLTDPADPAPYGDGAAAHLQVMGRAAVFEANGTIYAAATSSAHGNGDVEIFDLTHPAAPRAVGHVADTAGLLLNGTAGIAPFEFAGRTLLAVASFRDDGVQVIMLGPPGRPPVVDAGPDLTVLFGQTVTLNGTASDPDNNPDNNLLTYTWNYPDAANLITGVSDKFKQNLTFTAPNTRAILNFTLVVQDILDRADDEVTVTVVPSLPPTVSAGPDLTVLQGSTVTLNGTASDPEGDPLTYQWSHAPNRGITDKANFTTLNPTFTVPDKEGTFTFTLAVSDSDNTVSDTMTLTVSPNLPPTVVSAGPDQTVTEGDLVVLRGTATDPDSGILSYSWSHERRDLLRLPGIYFSSPDAHTVNFTAPDVPYDVTVPFTLSVWDGNNWPVRDQMLLTILDADPPGWPPLVDPFLEPGNRPPSADAGTYRDKYLSGQAVTLSGTASDPDGDAMTYEWRQTSGTAATLSNADTLNPSFTAPVVNYYDTLIFTLAVIDEHGLFDTDEARVTIFDGIRITVDENQLVHVLDYPVITVRGSERVTVTQNSAWSDPGADCRTKLDGTPLTVTASGSADTTTPGTYTITYTCEYHGKTSATRTVTVSSDNEPPRVTILYIRPAVASGDTSPDYGSDAKCTDREDGNISHRITTSVSFSGDAATITYSCTDSGGKTATASTRAKVTADSDDGTPNTPPKVVKRSLPAAVKVGDTYSDPGAYCEDAEDGTFEATTTKNNVDTSKPGEYTVFYECVDSDGQRHIGGGVRTVTVHPADTNTDPVLTLSSWTVTVTVGGTYELPSATCHDAEDGDLTSQIYYLDEHAVDTSTPGAYVVYYRCEDSAGNSDTDGVTVTVEP